MVARFMYWPSSRIMRSKGCVPGVALVALAGAAGLSAFTDFCPRASGAEIKAATHFRKNIQPILTKYCYDCHGDGMDKGNVAFDELKSDEELLGKRDLWWAVLKNLRAGLMPPAKKPRPPEKEKRRLEDWIKYEAFGIDPKNPDPGRVTLRRLNRVEYRNTIRDLMGIEFKAAEEFPPDDTGYGFDNIGDVLTVSPLLLEKYMQAAETIVAVAVLASPRFLFRVEDSEANNPVKTQPLVDEYALASRLSYFLWSTMPDEELFRLAERGELRKNLASQVKRMLADSRSQELIENFTGQWLQVRDVEGIDINSRAVLGRENGEEKDAQESRRRFQELQAKSNLTPEEERERDRLIEQRRRRFSRPTIELDGPLRRAMRQETEMYFGHVVREDRSVLELIDGDYTFLNERLAKHYGIPDVKGSEMRRVTLSGDSPRGGLLTQGSVLVVTSNPTRTSPVKRGLFILDNIMGSPTAPPPADVPLLEEAEKQFKDREPTLREVLELHRGKPLCSSCHSRMDPLGLALENFNALGMWREKERAQPIQAAGQLITGESFDDIRDLKRILKSEHRSDFYRCLTEKLLTYALGRGLEYYDVESVDRIVARLEREDGRFSALLMGIVESAPFQKRRNLSTVTDARPAQSLENGVQARLQP